MKVLGEAAPGPSDKHSLTESPVTPEASEQGPRWRLRLALLAPLSSVEAHIVALEPVLILPGQPPFSSLYTLASLTSGVPDQNRAYYLKLHEARYWTL